MIHFLKLLWANLLYAWSIVELSWAFRSPRKALRFARAANGLVLSTLQDIYEPTTGKLKDLPPDYEECGTCGFDHEYEYPLAKIVHDEIDSLPDTKTKKAERG